MSGKPFRGGSVLDDELGLRDYELALPAPLVCLALVLIAGVWLGETIGEWLPTPSALYAIAAFCLVLMGWSSRLATITTPPHPSYSAKWRPRRTYLVMALFAIGGLAAGTGHYLAYIEQIELALPESTWGAGRPVSLLGVVMSSEAGSAGRGPDGDEETTRPTGRRFRVQLGAYAVTERGSNESIGAASAWISLPARPLVEVRVPPPPTLGEEFVAHPYSPLDVEVGDTVLIRGIVRRPRPARVPGGFPEREVYVRQGVSGIVDVPHQRHIAQAPEGWERSLSRPLNGLWPARGSVLTGWLPRVAESWKGHMENALVAHLPGEREGFLLRSLLFGDRTLLDAPLQKAVQRAGLMHLLAVSGLHVGFVGALVATVAALLRLPRGVSIAVAASIVVLYVLAVGARPPAVRAGVTILFGLLMQTMRRRSDGPTAASIAALGLIVYRPTLALDLSFQLSFAASLGIWLVTQRLARGLEAARSVRGSARPIILAFAWLASGMAVSITAQLATAPLIWRHFGEVSWLGVVANLVAVPLTALIVPLALVGSTLYGIVEPVGGIVLGAASSLVRGLIFVIQTVAAWPVDPLPDPFPNRYAFVFWYGVLIAMAVWTTPGPSRPALRRVDAHLRRIPWMAVCSLLSSALIGGWIVTTLLYRPPLHIYFLDVGQAAAALVRAPTGEALLIDGGRGRFGNPHQADYDAGRRFVVPALRHLGIKRLHAVINTHPDEDHLGGLIDVLENVPVGVVLDSGQRGEGSSTWHHYEHVIQSQGIPHWRLEAGQVIHLSPEVTLEVLHPSADYIQETSSDTNNNSVVMRLRYREATWLFTGDLDREGQQAVLQSGVEVAADGLQVPHHGSSSAYWFPFLAEVSPRWGVIQVGRNAFGHPTPEVLRALHTLQAIVCRTDRSGTVKISTRGSGWYGQPAWGDCEQNAGTGGGSAESSP